uniref:Uncharacterized protein n=1 Tax=Octopus bimaculoides TaxID=37653 RepID=A0A0L8HD74_OCTBM
MSIFLTTLLLSFNKIYKTVVTISYVIFACCLLLFFVFFFFYQINTYRTY